jgi:transcriptional regulator with XRE-family HTH domain
MTETVVLKKLQSFMIDLMTNLDAIFSKNLVKYRKAKGYASADSFAEAIEISLRTLQRYEAGERLPSSDKIEKMASMLGVQVQEFFKTEETIVIERSEPISLVAKRLLAIPDEIYDLAIKVGPGHEIWDAVRGSLNRAIDDGKEKKSKHHSNHA